MGSRNKLRLKILVPLFIVWAGAVHAACSESRVTLRGEWGQAAFTVEIADDAAERNQGLMHRESMSASAGMLFLYPRPQRMGFWMRNTLIELDMIFIDPEGVVQKIHERAQPLDETVITGPGGMLAVLEINGGLSRRLGMTVGSEVRHPFFGEGAAWPC